MFTGAATRMNEPKTNLLAHDDPHALEVDASANQSEQAKESLIDAVFDLIGNRSGYLTDENAGIPWVLHIDDDHEISQWLKVRLEAHGVAYVHACDGTQGYRTAFTHPANAIILDYHMPNGQGDYVLRRLKENPITKDIPVIMLTGAGDRNLERRLLNMGADCYLGKPVEFDRLRRELQRHIDILASALPTHS